MKKVLFILLFAPFLGLGQQVKVDSMPSELEKRIMILENVVNVQNKQIERLSLANKTFETKINSAAFRIEVSGSWILIGIVCGVFSGVVSYAAFYGKNPEAFAIGTGISGGISLVSLGMAGGKLITASRKLDPSLAANDD